MVSGTSTSVKKENRVAVIELLRGVAAVLVVFFHYSVNTIPTLIPNSLAPIGEYGGYGVEMFFVISGFVIYLTLHKLGHAPTLADTGKFLLRRSIRVIGPAWASLALTLGVFYGSAYLYKPIYLGWPAPNAKTMACNVLMCCSLAGGHWINAVYWTLEVELCFYFTMSVLFFLWRGNSARVIATYFALGIALWILGSTRTFPVYMLTFIVGVLLADVLVRGAPLKWCLPFAIAALGIVYFRAGPISMTFCAIAAVAIYFFYEARLPAWMMFLGTVSYSLYLTHTLAAFFGEFLIRRLLPFHGTDAGRCLLVFVYIAFAVGWSYAFYRVIEAPVVRLARALR